MPDAILVVRVLPNSKQPGILVDQRGVTVRVRARPVEGSANEAARRALAHALGLAPSSVQLIRGATSRLKTFAIAGVDDRQIVTLLGESKLTGPVDR